MSQRSWGNGLGGSDTTDVGDMVFNVSRDGANITCNLVSVTMSGTTYSSVGGGGLTPITYNLGDNEFTKKFGGANSIGFAFWSQDLGGFKDVTISLPSVDYWGAVRIETENNVSDNGLYELSSDIEGDTNNLLKQEVKTEPILSTLAWTGAFFKASALVNTKEITNGQPYKLSAELGAKNLTGDVSGILDLLSPFAWIDSNAPSKLNVMFNSSVSSSSTTGVTLTNSGGVTVTSLDVVTSNFITYNLSGDMGAVTGLTVDFAATDIVRVSDSVALTTTSTIVYNDL